MGSVTTRKSRLLWFFAIYGLSLSTLLLWRVTVDILMCLKPERGPRTQTGCFRGSIGNE